MKYQHQASNLLHLNNIYKFESTGIISAMKEAYLKKINIHYQL